MPRTPTRMELLVRQAVAQEIDDCESIWAFSLDSELEKDWGIDDVGKVMIATFFEERLRPAIPEIPVADSSAWRTVRDVLNYIEARYRI